MYDAVIFHFFIENVGTSDFLTSIPGIFILDTLYEMYSDDVMDNGFVSESDSRWFYKVGYFSFSSLIIHARLGYSSYQIISWRKRKWRLYVSARFCVYLLYSMPNAYFLNRSFTYWRGNLDKQNLALIEEQSLFK